MDVGCCLGQQEKSEKSLREAFDNIDVDHSGTLDRIELTEALKLLGKSEVGLPHYTAAVHYAMHCAAAMHHAIHWPFYCIAVVHEIAPGVVQLDHSPRDRQVYCLLIHDRDKKILMMI